MLRRAVFPGTLFLAAFGIAVGQTPSAQPLPPQSPAPIIVSPGNHPDLPTPQLPDAQKAAAPEPPHLKPADLDSRPALNDGTKMQLIRLMDAEFAHVRKYFPIGDKSMLIAPDGAVKPGDDTLFRMAQNYGAAAKIGD